MSESTTVAMFKGRRADELTREELLEAYTHAVKDLERMREIGRQNAEMEALFAFGARKRPVGL